MPNALSFASAAAGNPDNSTRREGSGNDWSRQRANGTQTFRRPSTQSRDNLHSGISSSAGPYIPPHMNQQANTARNGVTGDMRYSRDDILSIYSAQKEAGVLGANISQYFAGPRDLNSDCGRYDTKDPGPEVCWQADPISEPFGLRDLDESEKQLFSTSVNSPLKLNNPKEGQGMGAGNRKTSLSTVNTSGSGRPGTRRRETSDSFAGNGPLSPSVEKSFRNDPMTSTPPPALQRRRTDLQEEPQEKEQSRGGKETDSPFGSIRRSGTGGPLSAGLNPPSASPWSTGPQSAFGAMGAFGSSTADPVSAQDSAPQRPGFGSARSTSRFKDILSKTSEDMSPSVKEKASFSGLEKLPEEDDSVQARLRENIKNRPNRSETNPYDDLMPRTGSAALSVQDEQGIEQMGFSAFHQGKDHSQTPHNRFSHDPTSPTNTNPYQSPQGGRMQDDDGHEGQPGLPYGRRDVFSGEHRGQNSFGSLRGMGSVGSMGGLGGIPGWGNPGFGTGTPGRERPPVSAAFGNSVFSPLTDLQSPGAVGGNSFFSAGPGFGVPGQSKLNSIFPPAMQDQMRSDSRNDAFDGRGDPFEPRRQDSFRTPFEEMKRPGEDAFNQPLTSRSPGGPRQTSSAQGSDSGSASQLPTAQQRQMVMPDRMRWVYRDPHGNVQGPWSGLEMHDWFKAGFFTAELQVKKVEDTDYEPLAQLVRRIGNSREPFLVPQIGVPHGPGQQGASSSNPWSAASPTTSAQPPFASSFPSFGTTLTADQQNALERRKQEEQFLMARQKEFLVQRQGLWNGPSGPNGPHMLHNQSSAQSLHSQPSFGSMNGPGGYQPSPMQAPIQPPHHGGPFQSMTPTSAGPQDQDLGSQFARMGLDLRGPYSANPQNQQSFAAHERKRLSMENQQAQLQHESTFLGQGSRNERLEEFYELRHDTDDDEDELGEEALPQPIGSQRPVEELVVTKQPPVPIGKKAAVEPEPLSLTQQVQRTAAANKQAAEDSPVVEQPPVSISPLPAPAAQRKGVPLAEQLAAESRSAAQTPIETSTSLAPWADKTSELPKGPSLKEIQEAEARRAAEQDASMAEARKVQARVDAERAAVVQAVAPAPGLPSSSTWASSGSPATPTTPGGGVWAKPVASKPATGSAKKTLAQIQREEEARKQKAAAQAAASVQAAAYANPTVPTGNRYAQMATKVTATQPTGPVPVQHTHTGSVGSAWTTVGASGKPKTPATVIATPPPAQRPVSSSALTMAAASRQALVPSRSTSLAGGKKDQAKDELIKWVKSQLSRGLNSGINVDDFSRNLLEYPPEVDIVSDAVYASSDTLDGRRFAEEFLRRRKQAEKGIFEPDNKTAPAESKPSNGWNEVAKKGPVKEDTAAAATAGFKVVSKKAKGKR